jgi:hypothetical protein
MWFAVPIMIRRNEKKKKNTDIIQVEGSGFASCAERAGCKHTFVTRVRGPIEPDHHIRGLLIAAH